MSPAVSGVQGITCYPAYPHRSASAGLSRCASRRSTHRHAGGPMYSFPDHLKMVFTCEPSASAYLRVQG